MARAAVAARPLRASALWLDTVDSTNAEARRRAEDDELGPLWIAARRQTAGRGRRGREWETGGGNLAATLLTTADKPPIEAAQVAFVAALAVYDLAVLQIPETLVRVKWPNDVLVAGRKASGVLIESGKRRDGRLWLAVGIGVNLASSPVAAERPATCLKDHLRADVAAPLTPPAALEAMAQAFDRWFETWLKEGFEPLRLAWSERAELGRPCTVRLDHETLEGVAEALEADGALRLRLSNGAVRRITAGDVFFPDTP